MYERMLRWNRKRLKIRNPFKGLNPMKVNPGGLAMKLLTFVFTLAGLVVSGLWLRVFKDLVKNYTDLDNPSRLPNGPKQIAFWACGVSVISLLATFVLAYEARYEAIGTFFLAICSCAFAGQWLKRKVPRRITP